MTGWMRYFRFMPFVSFVAVVTSIVIERGWLG